MKANKCVFCGADCAPELHICPNCLKAGGIEAGENLQDIAAIISMAADTDKNLKNGMNGILHMAGRLKNGGITMNRITLTEKQREIVARLGDATYTPEYLEKWMNRTDSVYINAPAALSAMGAQGFYSAVLAIERAEIAAESDGTPEREAEPPAEKPKRTRNTK